MAEEKKYLSFIDTRPFDAAWKEFGLSDEDHADLEDRILDGPTRHPVIPGTAGIRKMRYAPPRWKTGKRGALRVCYVCFVDLGTIILLTVYPKNVKDTLSVGDKALLNQAVSKLRASLEEFRQKRRQ
ncbi:MAG: hypothetical protein WD063_08855 [Pirellulales bacterium]